MRKIHRLLYLFGFICLYHAPQGAASDLAKEQRWSAQIVDSLIVGEPADLKAGDTPFLGIFSEASEGPTGRAVIVMHGMGAHPDWPEVVHPLRTMLPEHGWSTLSIQMPILANDAAMKDYLPLFDEVGPRIRAAVTFLREKGNQTIILIGHSLGASMGAVYAAEDKQQSISGFVAIGMSVIDIDDKMNSAVALEKIRMPVLDLYGSRDLAAVIQSAKLRSKAARQADNPSYRQLQIEGADHFFIGLDEELTRRVYGWLKTNFEKEPREP